MRLKRREGENKGVRAVQENTNSCARTYIQYYVISCFISSKTNQIKDLLFAENIFLFNYILLNYVV